MLDSIDLSEGRPRLVGRLVAYDGLMLAATGFGRPIGSGARVIAAAGRAARAAVVGFRGARTLLMALDGEAAHASGPRVDPESRGGMAEVGTDQPGRVVRRPGSPPAGA